MQKISRAGDSLWVVSAFDPRKPVDPDWATRDPAPVLRSGDEERVFRDSPHEHDHMSDMMQSRPVYEEPDYEDPNSEYYDPYTDPRYDGGDIPVGSLGLVGRDVPDNDLRQIGLHAMDLVSSRAGHLEGSQGHYVEYPTTGSVSHYYTHHPTNDADSKWSLQSSHSLLRDPIISHHPDFESAVSKARSDRAVMESQARREFGD